MRRHFKLWILLAGLGAGGCLYPVQAPAADIDLGQPLPDCSSGVSCACPDGWTLIGETCKKTEPTRSISISTSAGYTLIVGETTTLTAYPDGTGLDAHEVRWSVSNAQAAQLSATTGATTLLTAKTAGNATVRAELVEKGKVTAHETLYLTFTLPPAPPETSQVVVTGLYASGQTGNALSFFVGLADQYSAARTLEDGESVSFEVDGISEPTGTFPAYTAVLNKTEGTATLVAIWSDGTREVRSAKHSIAVQQPEYGFKVGSTCTSVLNMSVGSRTWIYPARIDQGCEVLPDDSVQWNIPAGLVDEGDEGGRKIFMAEAGSRAVTYTYGSQASGELRFNVSSLNAIVDDNATATSCTVLSGLVLDLDSAPSRRVRVRSISKMSAQNEPEKCDTPSGLSAGQWGSAQPGSVRVDEDGADPSLVTLVGLQPAHGVSVWVEGGGVFASVAVTVAGTPLTLAGTASAKWTSARTYTVSWTHDASDPAALFRVRGHGPGGDLLVEGLSGLSADVTVPVASSGWSLSVQAYKGAQASGSLPVSIEPLQPAPAQPAATLVGTDGGAYSVPLGGGESVFLGLLAEGAPQLVRTAPRANTVGALFALGAHPTSGLVTPLVRTPGTNTWQAPNWGLFSFQTTPDCSAQPYFAAFPVNADLVSLSANPYLPCGVGGSLYVSNQAPAKTQLVAERVTSATAFGDELDGLAYVSNRVLYVLHGNLALDLPVPVSTGLLPADGYVVGAGEFLYFVGPSSVLMFNPSTTSAGTALTVSAPGLVLSDEASGYGLRSGELLLPTTTGVAKGTVSGTTLTLTPLTLPTLATGEKLTTGYLGSANR